MLCICNVFGSICASLLHSSCQSEIPVKNNIEFLWASEWVWVGITYFISVSALPGYIIGWLEHAGTLLSLQLDNTDLHGYGWTPSVQQGIIVHKQTQHPQQTFAFLFSFSVRTRVIKSISSQQLNVLLLFPSAPLFSKILAFFCSLVIIFTDGSNKKHSVLNFLQET